MPRRDLVPRELGTPVWMVARGDSATAVFHGVAATEEGVFCVLDVLGQDFDLSLGFGLDGPGGSQEPQVWLEVLSADGDVGDSHLSQLVAGEGGRSDDGLERWTFRLWFPLDLDATKSATLHIRWAMLEPKDGEVQLSLEALKSAAAQAARFQDLKAL